MPQMNLLHNYLVVFFSFSPLFAVLINRMPFLSNIKGFIISQASLILLAVLLFTQAIPYTVPYIWLYPVFMFILNDILTLKFGFKSYSKILAVSLMAGFLLTETHEIANFMIKYLELATTLSWQSLTYPLHPLTNLYSLLVGYVLFKEVNFKQRIYPFLLVFLLVVSSFVYYLFFYEKAFIPVIRFLQFFIFMYIIKKGGQL